MTNMHMVMLSKYLQFLNVVWDAGQSLQCQFLMDFFPPSLDLPKPFGKLLFYPHWGRCFF